MLERSARRTDLDPAGAAASARRALLLAALLTLASGASAETLIGNYPPSNDLVLDCVADVFQDCSTAAGFTMPAGPDYRLESVTLRLDVYAISEFSLLVRLYAGESAPTGSALMTLVNPTLSFGVGDFVFTPPARFTLAAATTYWIVVNGSVQGSPFDGQYIAWRGSSPGITPTGLATSAGFTIGPNGQFPPTTPSSDSTTYQVAGSPMVPAVPGLGPAALGALATLLLAAGLRRIRGA
jgi:hypothetical protein